MPRPGSASIGHGCLGINVSSGGAAHLISTPSSSTSHVKEETTRWVQLPAPPSDTLPSDAKLNYLYTAYKCKQRVMANAFPLLRKVK